MKHDIPDNISIKLQNLPKKPGTYIFRGEKGTPVYIGKAVNLSNRVRSYFSNYKRLEPRIRLMVDGALDLDYYEVESEVEALLLESNLIKKYKPKYSSYHLS